MIQIGDKVVHFNVFDEMFVCDINKCKGQCCIDGDAGAPLEDGEAEKLREVYPLIKNDMAPEAVEIVEKNGVSYLDKDGDEVTAIVNGKDCAFVCHNEEGIALCAVEKAFREGKTTFRKPVSCYLYPIRLQQYRSFMAVNVHKWDICKCAFECGEKLGVPVYKFLKEPLTEKFGKEWYDELCVAAEEYGKAKEEWKKSTL